MHKLEKDKDITDLSNFGTKAKSKYFFQIDSFDDLNQLKELIKFIRENNLKYTILWGWTNVLFWFDYYPGVIIKNQLKMFNFEDNILEVGSGEVISDIAEELEYKYNNTVLHRFIWLPGFVGWAIVGNAWCFGLEIKNNFVSCEVFDFNENKIKTFSKEDMNFGYRSSILKKNKNYMVLTGKFDLSFVDEKYSSDVDNIWYRENKQPKWYSCGSFFKNPEWESAGRLIEQVWLKWYKLGWAFFSEKHWNFLMSDGTASYEDIVNLKNLAIEKVKNEFNLTLEPEILIVD